jgi:hypothetical protein
MCQMASASLRATLDPGHGRAALLAQPLLGALVVVTVQGVASGVGGGLDQRPAQVLGAVVA